MHTCTCVYVVVANNMCMHASYVCVLKSSSGEHDVKDGQYYDTCLRMHVRVICSYYVFLLGIINLNVFLKGRHKTRAGSINITTLTMSIMLRTVLYTQKETKCMRDHAQ